MATLGRHAARVAVPTYERSALTPSVVHVSVGSFHRSHQAVYFDRLAQERVSEGWGIVGVGLHRPELREALVVQDGLYTVVSRGRHHDDARVVGAIRRYLFAPDDAAAVVDALADARTRLVTLTITGNGYHPEGGAMTLLAAALGRRRAAGLAPFTVLSCDNVPDNGRLARDAVVAAAAREDETLADWIAARTAFPSSMVDRITPRTTDADRELVARQFGIRDAWPVMTEPFSQWVIEDVFSAGRPPLDAVGVQFTTDVRPYALIKTRLLNGSHCAIGHVGALAGHATIDEALADPALALFVEGLMTEEVGPLLPAVPGVDQRGYRATLLERFANPKIADPLWRLRRNGSAKVPVHLLASLGEARAAGRPHGRLTLAVAAWLRCVRGTDLTGAPLPVEDPLADMLRSLALEGGTDPRPLMRGSGLFGALADDQGLADELEAALVALDRDGLDAVLAGAPALAA
jgi:fructuronate reductase/mannitol 2-dehydrogenase